MMSAGLTCSNTARDQITSTEASGIADQSHGARYSKSCQRAATAWPCLASVARALEILFVHQRLFIGHDDPCGACLLEKQRDERLPSGAEFQHRGARDLRPQRFDQTKAVGNTPRLIDRVAADAGYAALEGAKLPLKWQGAKRQRTEIQQLPVHGDGILGGICKHIGNGSQRKARIRAVNQALMNS
jgi:hypothetical protein